MKWRGVALLGLVTSLLACTQQLRVTVVGPEGFLEILGPTDRFATNLEDGTWLRLGDMARGRLAVTKTGPAENVFVRAGPKGFSLLRPVDTRLLATPFLAWSWNPETLTDADHPAAIVVGFMSSPQHLDEDRYGYLDTLPNTLPVNRLLEIRWAASALKRGHQTISGDPENNTTIYVARGGRENTGRWWRDGVELSKVYETAWPQDRLRDVRITFVGLKVAEADFPSALSIADINLFR